MEVIQRGLCTRECISRLAPSCGESMHFFALNTGWMDEIVAKFFCYKKQHKMHIFKLFIVKSKTGERCICWAAIYSIRSPLASITALIRPLNWAKALKTMSLSMEVNTSVMEANRLAMILQVCLMVCLSNLPETKQPISIRFEPVLDILWPKNELFKIFLQNPSKM